MPRRLKYLHRQVSRHGAVCWYVRVGRGKRIRIRETHGTPEFNEAYLAALKGEAAPAREKIDDRSIAWLIAEYRKSLDWSRLSKATRKQRDNIFSRVVDEAGASPFIKVRPEHIERGLSKRAATPFAANNFLKTMRGLFRWARKAGHVTKDPTRDVEGRTPRTDGFRVWTDADIDAFEARWPVGTRERLALEILIYTGLRRGDAARLGPAHVRNGVIEIATEKTNTPVIIPMLPVLADAIAASPTGKQTFIARNDGGPFVKESFGNWFKDACKAAGVAGSAHGLRKAGATRAADNGATEAQLEAIYGWHGGKMAALYTRAANRKRMAADAMGKLEKRRE